MEQTDPPAKVASNDQLGLDAEARKCAQGYTRGSLDRCANMRCTYEGMDGERYRCDRCGESYFLDYEEMR